MGKDLTSGSILFDEFSELTQKADEILGYSIKDLCLNDPDNKLKETQYTQPSLFTVNALMYLKKIKEGETKPDYVAGHSLGEYNALLASGVMSFETGLRLVQKRGELMSKATGGSMAAIVGISVNEIDRLLKLNNLHNIDIANYNTPSQIVISGAKTELEQAEAIFKRAGANYFPLNVGAAFHSRYMAETKKIFERFLDEFEFSEIQIPIISNTKARPYMQNFIKKNLTEQITSPVEWTEGIRYLMGVGDMDFEEVGPGKVLTNLIAKIQKEAKPLVIKDSIAAEDKQKDKAKNGIIAKKTTRPIDTNKKVGLKISAESLGSEDFKKDYNVKYAYAAGSMVRGISSKELVVRMGKVGMIGYFGTGGLSFGCIEENIQYIQKELSNNESFGMNLLNNMDEPNAEENIIDLYLKHGVQCVEASAYMQSLSLALVKYRLKGLSKNSSNQIEIKNKIMAKVSRPEVAEAFMSPAPDRIVKKLLEVNKVSAEEVDLAKRVPMADHVCVEADSGGHTDQGVAYVLMPAMLKLRDEMMAKNNYAKRIGIGAAGGIGTPEAAAAAFILGAEFILTGSINQCTVEAGTSDIVKDLLQQMNVQDTEYAVSGDMFEIGAKVQLLSKGLFFPARAKKLYEVYQRYNSLDEIDEKTRKQIQERYFKKNFDEVYEITKSYWIDRDPQQIEKAEKNPKHKMALVFRWYYFHAIQAASEGNERLKVDFQILTGPCLGAFNQWVKGTDLEDWRNRHVDQIGLKLLDKTVDILNERFKSLQV